MMGHKRKQGDYNSLSMLKDPGIILSFAWLVFMTYRYAVSLPLLEQGEKLFYLLGEVQYFNNALGIGFLLLMSSNWFARKLYKGIFCALQSMVAVITISISMLIVAYFLFTPDKVQWGSTAKQIAEGMEDYIVVVPFAPITSKLIQGMSPFEATVRQICFIGLICWIYGMIICSISALTERRLWGLGICFIFHLLGKYALEAWPSWVRYVPHSYFFIQNYDELAPLPASITSASFSKILLISTGCFICCLVVSSYIRRRRHSSEDR